MSTPHYRLRPNKSIERMLFIELLTALESILPPLSQYQYIGFGAQEFEEYKILHNRLHFTDMISIESDIKVFRRQQYNKPLGCIKLENMYSGYFLTDHLAEDEDKNIILWLDFTTPAELAKQLEEFSIAIQKLNPMSIIKITLNAEASALGRKEESTTISEEELRKNRLATLIKRLNNDEITDGITAQKLTLQNYPYVLLQILQKKYQQTLQYNHKKRILPLSSFVYKDGQQMLTFTAVILDNKDFINYKEKISEKFKNFPFFSFELNRPTHIDIPFLSLKEKMAINEILPCENAEQNLKENFPYIFNTDESCHSYISYYKYYPDFYRVIF